MNSWLDVFKSVKKERFNAVDHYKVEVEIKNFKNILESESSYKIGLAFKILGVHFNVIKESEIPDPDTYYSSNIMCGHVSTLMKMGILDDYYNIEDRLSIAASSKKLKPLALHTYNNYIADLDHRIDKACESKIHRSVLENLFRYKAYCFDHHYGSLTVERESSIYYSSDINEMSALLELSNTDIISKIDTKKGFMFRGGERDITIYMLSLEALNYVKLKFV